MRNIRELLGASAIFLLPCVADAASAYSIVQIGPAPKSNTSLAPVSINDQSIVVGYGLGFSASPVLFWQNGTTQTLSLGSISSASARGVNNSGVIVGYAVNEDDGNNSDLIERAFSYVGKTETLLSSPESSIANAINSSGVIAGSVEISDIIENAAIWKAGALINLAPSSIQESDALAINDSGTAVGYAALEPNAYQHTKPVMWQRGKMINLGSLGGSFGEAGGINAAGIVIGASGNVEGDEHAFDWQSGKMHDLGALSGDSSSIALGINTAGLIVGSSESNPSNEQAVLWNGTNITNLNTLLPARSGWDLTEADAINSLGQIAGIGLYNGQQSAFLLDPPNFKELNASIIDLIAPSSSVPEPVSAATFLGLTSLFFLDRRHKQV